MDTRVNKSRSPLFYIFSGQVILVLVIILFMQFNLSSDDNTSMQDSDFSQLSSNNNSITGIHYRSPDFNNEYSANVNIGKISFANNQVNGISTSIVSAINVNDFNVEFSSINDHVNMPDNATGVDNDMDMHRVADITWSGLFSDNPDISFLNAINKNFGIPTELSINNFKAATYDNSGQLISCIKAKRAYASLRNSSISFVGNITIVIDDNLLICNKCTWNPNTGNYKVTGKFCYDNGTSEMTGNNSCFDSLLNIIE